jgi:caa(3)-type oxidase subunit IV
MSNHGHGHEHGEHGNHSHAAPDNPAAHVDSPATVFVVFLLIAAGAVATIATSMAHVGDKAIFIHMVISTVQVCLVGYYWMHLKRSDSLTWLVALSGIFFMGILFALPLGDFLTRHMGGL